MNALEVGQQLRQAREAKALSLEQVAQTTHMRLRYLQALEEGNFEALPSLAQARGFLRAYAGYLNLPPEEYLTALNGQAVSSPAPAAPPSPSTAFSTRLQPEPVTASSYQEANRIFEDVGKRLQHQRELLGLSLDDVVRHTHLRRHYLQALEAGTLDVLPSPVQGRGMLNNYASFLGMDPEPLLLRFAEGLQSRLAVKQAVRQPAESPATAEKTKPQPKSRPKINLPAPLRRLFSSDLLIGSTLTVFLVGFVIWGAIRTFSLQADQLASPTAPSIADVLLATSTPTQTATMPPPTPTIPAVLAIPAAADTALPPDLDATAIPEDSASDETGETSEISQEGTGEEGDTEETEGEAGAEEGEAETEDSAAGEGSPTAERVQVYITVRERAWMRAVVDGKIELEGRVLPGSAYTFAGDEQVEILTGNGAAIQIFFNEQDLGLMGVFGQVVNRVYTLQGVMTPTPTATATPSATARVSATPSAPAATPGPGIATAPALP